MTERYKRYTVKIFNLKDEFVGMGFLIGRKYVLTCSHVIGQCTELRIEMPFILGDRKILGKVVENIPKKDSSLGQVDDIAVIEIWDDDVIKLTAYSYGPNISYAESESLINHNIEVLGYPSNHPSGKIATAAISGSLASNRLQMHNLFDRPYENVDKGFSGAPVWDKDIESIIGIIVSVSFSDKMAYAISLKYIAEKSSILKQFVSYGELIFKSSLDNIKKARKLFVEANLLMEEDLKRLESISIIIKNEWETVRDPKYLFQDSYSFSAYDDVHSIFVEEKLFELLVDNLSYASNLRLDEILSESDIVNRLKEFHNRSNLTSKEIFVLLASAWLHDIGMNPKINRDANKKIAFSTILQEHHTRSSEYIDKNSTSLGLQPHEKEPLKKLCELHRHKEYKVLYETIDSGGYKIALLASYLRLAGALQISQKEATGSFMAVGFSDAFSRFQWLKSQVAVRSTIDRDNFEAIIEVSKIRIQTNDEKHIDILKKLIERELQNEIDSTRNIFIKNRLNAYISAKCKFVDQGELNKNEVKEILLNIELFESIISPTSSSIMDIVLEQVYSIILPENNLNVNEKLERLHYLKTYSGRVLRNVVEARPCHVPLHKVYDFLTYIFSTSELNISTADKIHNDISTKIKYWYQKKDIIRKNLHRMAYGLLKDRTPILLYGYSRCIINCIREAIKEDPEIRKTPLYICQAATKNEYRYNNRLVYNDALKYIKDLKTEDINMEKINYVVDVAGSNLFSKQKISKVLFGANGIEYEGFIHHTLGHLAIADMASIYNVPVYVIADSFKIGPIIDEYPRTRENQWLTTDIEEEYVLEQTGISNYNPRGDRVPPERISSIVTEKGICKAKDIRYHADDYSEVCISKGYSLYKKGDTKNALILFKKALEADPKNSAANVGINLIDNYLRRK